MFLTVFPHQWYYLLIHICIVFFRLYIIEGVKGPKTTVQCYFRSQSSNATAHDFIVKCLNGFQTCDLSIMLTGDVSYIIEDLPPFELLVTNCSRTGIDKHIITIFDISRNRIGSIPNNYFCGFDNLAQLILSSNVLFESDSYGIAPECESNITILQMRHNAFLAVHDFSFVGSPNLVELDLSINRISTIGDFAFHKLDRLRQLKLNNNNLHDIALRAFQPLVNLQQLDLSKNKLNESIVVDFKYLVRLKLLNLETNRYRTINGSLFAGLTRLETLLLGQNIIRNIRGAFSTLTGLVHLDLKLNTITTLTDAGFCNMPKLATLLASTNRITSVLTGTFCQNNSLETLDLRSNKITLFPKIAPLEKLQDLLLAANTMTELSSDDVRVFCHLKSLRHLDVSQNFIANIKPGMLDCLQNLTVLMLNNNRLTSINGLLNATSKKLESLMLHSNQITEFFFEDIPTSVMMLNMSKNSVHQFPRFRATPRQNMSMRMLDLSLNPIRGTVPITELPVLLEHLNLSGNNINYLTIFNGPKNSKEEPVLKSLNLQLNSIFMACQPLLQFVHRKIATVQLSGNKLICDCEIDLIQRHVKKVRTVDRSYITFGEEEAQQLLPNSTVMDANEVPNPEDFLCQTLSSTAFKYQCNIHSAYNSKCGLPCPDICSCYVNSKFDMQLINCSSRGLNRVQIMTPSALRVTLNLSRNYLESLNSTMMMSYPNLHALHLDHNHLRFIDSNALQVVPKIRHLNLRHNLLTSILPSTFDNMQNLVHLDLAFNLLVSIPEDVFQPMHFIQHLEMHNNLLKNFSVWNLGHLASISSLQVTLRNNPWSCDCDYIEQFRGWLQNYSKVVIDINEVYCTPSNGTVASTPLISFNASHCYEAPPYQVLMDNIPVLASTLAVVGFLSLSSALMFFYRRELQVLLYSHYGIKLFYKDEEDPDKKYDGFIAYSSLDSDFVVEILLPGLEGIENPYTMCLHERDFLVGGYISENILEAVASSRRTIVVLSENFVSSNWCRYEFLMAHLQMLHDKCNRVIVILLGKIPDNLDPEMKLYLKTNTYLQWGDNLFWEKLYYALPRKIIND